MKEIELQMRIVELERQQEIDKMLISKTLDHSAELAKQLNDIRGQKSSDHNRERLAELTTILNAIPLYRLEAACGLARELVERRIEGVKKEMQGNGN